MKARLSQDTSRHLPLHSLAEAPLLMPNNPALHRVHDAAPDRLYNPGPHNSGKTEPAGHAFPATQLPLHSAVVRPASDPYLPPGHGGQDPTPPSLYVPAPHRDTIGLVDPAAHAYPAEHAPVHSGNTRPDVDPYLPAEQGPLQAAAVALVEPTAHTYPAEHAPEQPAVVRPSVAPYLPPGHGVQDPTPPSLYVPALQRDAVGEVDRAAHAYPAEHAPEQPAVVRPSVAPYLPAGHGPLQAAVDRPDVDPYKPTAQLLQEVAPDRLYVPTGQVAAVALRDPAAHAYPAAQLPLHAAVVRPALDPYLPPGHGVQDPAPPSLYVPAPHRNAVECVDPAGHAYPAEHAPVHSGNTRPDVDPYLPARQGPLQAAVSSPVVVPYSPALHMLHDAAPDKL
jgi:hypothetical protein